MMKKRKGSPASGQDDSDSDSQMDVDGEEKQQDVMEEDHDDDNDDNNDDDEVQGSDLEKEERNPGSSGGDNSFMDDFYGLSSSDPSERAQAANSILNHCLIGPDANTKDAAYALRRLLNGLCSGRAASRQGNASALASFLKVSSEGNQLKDIQNEDTNEEAKKESTILGYVRHRLLKATDPSSTQGKKKGSEERDYQFGRLFGILSVARSGILLPDSDGMDEILDVSRGFIADLIELYSQKKWMREPAAHAIGTILNMFYSEGETKEIAKSLVEELVIPQLLQNDSGMKDYEAEQIALALTIQSNNGDNNNQNDLPSPLNKPILSPETMPSVAQVLIETSSVALPRTHLVWDALWVYLTEPENGPLQKEAGARLGIRKLRDKPLVGSNSSQEIIESLVRRVIVEGLLRVDATTESGGKKTTHEKRALALCLVRNLFGAPFTSSITGATKIQLDADQLETILTPLIIRRLFLDVLCAGGGSAKRAHTLKPLAIQILESIINSMGQDTSDAGMERRLRMAIAFVKCEPKFDNVTKTTTVSDLVGMNSTTTVSDLVGTNSTTGATPSQTTPVSTVQKFFDFLEEQVMSSVNDSDKEGDMLSYLELLYQSSKRLLRIEVADNNEADGFRDFALKTVERVVAFFMAASFFDCDNFSADKSPASGKRGKKGKARLTADKNPAVEAATRLNKLGNNRGGGSRLSYNVRSLLSERFYSLLAEYVHASMQGHGGDAAKDSIMLDILAVFCNGWKAMEFGGAKPLFPAIQTENEDGESQSPQEMVFQLHGLAKDLATKAEKNPDSAELRSQKRCATGCAVLASSLFLHLLGCGTPDDIMDEDNVTTEDEDDSADIVEALEGIAEFTPLILDDSESSEENPLVGFADVCISVFSSRISGGNADRGASPKLLREAVKFAWMGVLSSSAKSDRARLDSDVISVLLSGVGADQSSEDEGEEEGDASDEEMEDEDEDSSDKEFGDFSKAGKILDADDEDNNDSDGEGDDSSERQGVDEDEQDVEIDSDKLTSLLQDDSDAGIDAGELEHHEGADAALATLIKMRQEARKAGRQAREKLEMEKQLRCTFLLETLLQGKSDSWVALLRTDVILGMSLPLLSYRSQIETSLMRSTGKSADTSAKKAMLDRLTSILKSKLFKLKIMTIPSTDSVDKVDYLEGLASSLMDMAQKSTSKDQRECCSAGLACVLKAIPDIEGILKVASIYWGAVEAWATKRTTRLEVSIFDHLITQSPSVAQAVLVSPLASAATTARSPFLRCECYRLLASLYNPKLNPQSTELDKQAIKKAGESAREAADAVIAGLQDDNLQKAKRVREVLKAAERILEFSIAAKVSLPNADDLSAAITNVGTSVDNQGVKQAIEQMTPLFGAMKADTMDVETKAAEEDEAEERDSVPDEGTGNKSKKAKKKKKKKRGKK